MPFRVSVSSRDPPVCSHLDWRGQTYVAEEEAALLDWAARRLGPPRSERAGSTTLGVSRRLAPHATRARPGVVARRSCAQEKKTKENSKSVKIRKNSKFGRQRSRSARLRIRPLSPLPVAAHRRGGRGRGGGASRHRARGSNAMHPVPRRAEEGCWLEAHRRQRLVEAWAPGSIQF